MTQDDINNIKLLIGTLERNYTIDSEDNVVLKAIMYNTALRDALELIKRYKNGEISQDVMENINGSRNWITGMD